MRITRKLTVAAAIAVAFAVGLPGLAAAQNAPGLGSAQPNTPDVSQNPQFHVYRWDMRGVTYIQVNDIVGNPVAAFAADAGGHVLVLPVGAPANVIVVTPAANAASAGAPVYKAGALNVTQVANGLTVSNSTMAQPQSLAVCQDPGECTAVVAQPTH